MIVRNRLWALLGLALLLTSVAGSGATSRAAVVAPDAAPPASAALADRFGVSLANADPRQMRTIGLTWFLWDGALGWAAEGADPSRIAPGTEFPFVIEVRDNVPEERIRAVAQRFPGKYWLIGNEPNVTTKENLKPEEYADALNRYATMIKRADPSAKLVGPNVLNWTFTCTGCPGYPRGDQWTPAMRAAYLAKFGEEPPLDVWAIHAYDLDWDHLPQGDAPRQIAQIKGMRDWLDSLPAQRGKPMWITEAGLHWGFPALEYRDEDGLFHPVGEFDYAHVEGYMRDVFGWLNDNAEALNIERWFVWAMYTEAEPWQSEWGGIALMNGRGPDAALTRLGRFYQQLAGVP